MRLSTIASVIGLVILSFSQAASADIIKLSTGETLNVNIIRVTATTITFVHPVLGEITVPKDSITIVPEPTAGEAAVEAAPAAASPEAAEAQDAAEKADAEKAEAAATQAAPVEPPAPPKLWHFKFLAGAGLASGNSDNANINAIATAVRETPETKLAMGAEYFYAEADSQANTNRFSAKGRHDWFNPGKKLFYFADLGYDWDEFQSWNSRINGHVGIGYKIFEPPKFKLNALAGMGFVKEWGSDDDDIRPEALLGVEGQYDFAEKHSIIFSSTYFPDVADPIDNYRWVNNLAYSVLLDKTTNLSFTAGLQDEYQSVVDPGREHNDLRVFMGLQLEF